jgi:hypothetical protein
LPETVEPIVHCVLEHCVGGESNHSSTTLVSFFELWTHDVKVATIMCYLNHIELL